MLMRLKWLKIANKLRDYLKAYRTKEGKRLFDYLVDRDIFKIRVGAGNTGEYPALYILFGDEQDVEKQRNIIGARVTLYLDLYVKGEATPDIDYDDNLYRQIYLAEEELVEALNQFNFHLHQNGLGSNLVVQAILSDGDENAPVVVAHRVLIEIEWYE